LEQIVNTISSDEDRLLKVMMEEELGLFLHHVNHPLFVGLWNGAAALCGGLIFGLPLVFLRGDAAHYWAALGGTAILGTISYAAARATRRQFMEFFGVGLIMAIVAGGAVFFISEWFAQWL
jgi:hypothetical protein